MPRDILVMIDACADGHEWQFVGGKNCGCEWFEHGERFCGNCSIPVLRCAHCGDWDYGDSEEAHEIRKQCAEYRAETGSTQET